MTTTYSLTYFDARGRAEPIRLLLSYAGVAFEDRGLDYAGWAKEKSDSPLGQAPYLVEKTDGQARAIPQSMAILRHLARVHGLDGKDENERLTADVAAETANDLRSAFAMLRYSPAWADDAAKAKFAGETAPTHLARLDKLLGDKTYFASSVALWADFLIFDALEGLTNTWSDILAKFPRLSAFSNRVSELPQLKTYLATRRPAG